MDHDPPWRERQPAKQVPESRDQVKEHPGDGAPRAGSKVLSSGDEVPSTYLDVSDVLPQDLQEWLPPTREPRTRGLRPPPSPYRRRPSLEGRREDEPSLG